MNNGGIRSENYFKIKVKKIKNIIRKNNINKIKYIGKNTHISSDCYFGSPENIKIGRNCSINNKGWFIATENINIGNDVLIGPKVAMFTSNHNYKNRTKLIRQQGYTFGAINIEDDVWIGYGATILYGVTLKKGCVVAAGSIVTKDVDEYDIVGGIPAKVIGRRK